VHRGVIRGSATAVVGVGAALSLFAGSVTASGTSTNRDVAGAAKVVKAIARIESKPRYRQSDWGYAVLDQKSGKVLAAQNARKMFDPARR
jgi:D-alanyl-D-alanine carboxypeptidase